MDLGNAIRRRREAAGQTQGELALAMDVSRQAVVALESSRSHPTIRTLLKVAHALGVSPSSLLRDAERLAK